VKLPGLQTNSGRLIAVLAFLGIVLVGSLGSSLVLSQQAASSPPGSEVARGSASAVVSSIQSPSPDPSAALTPSPAPSVAPGADPLLGTDGRFTVLLLGSDFRPAHPGNRTDAIMVVSLDPSSGKAAGFSIPRDTVNFPLATGGVFRNKVNALYQVLQSRTGDGGRGLSAAISKAFGIEIDGYVFIGFAGVKDLVAAVGGVDVTLDRPYYDPEYWVTATHRGWGLPAGRSHLGPNDALIFARSRKGDNDFGRARRQQLLVLAALDKARKAGVAKLPTLLAIAKSTVRTNLPLARAADLYRLVATTNIAKVDRVVFGPRSYASATGGTSFMLRLAACRAWIRAHFPPARPMAHWPLPAPVAPAPSTAPSVSPSG
jgi:polyisoprenyl-teichoic acid--peptidoglycan teichoic acid transferase